MKRAVSLFRLTVPPNHDRHKIIMEMLYNLWIYSRINRRTNDRKSKTGYQDLLQKNEIVSRTLDCGNNKRIKKV